MRSVTKGGVTNCISLAILSVIVKGLPYSLSDMPTTNNPFDAISRGVSYVNANSAVRGAVGGTKTRDSIGRFKAKGSRNSKQWLGLYKKGHRYYAHLPHAKNDLPIDLKGVELPLHRMVSETQSFLLRRFPNRVPKERANRITSRMHKHDSGKQKLNNEEVEEIKREYEFLNLVGTESNNNKHADFSKYIRIIFINSMKFIRQDIKGATFGEDNPELTTDPDNGGSPSGMGEHYSTPNNISF